MPSIIIGPIEINSNEGIIITGNTMNASPVSTSKVFSGSGSFNTGIYITNNNGVSTSNTLDPDLLDSNVGEAL
ncbi:spore germination protein [Ferdinandcohnia quinoae]|uniref:Spore germination protein n=1 Tax=Fredinandcohnia quinoae TaxID=2918902 RepID=A0AAW5E7S5_9BACI|nr:spore germination protein [Fredinandcohnia sp. SECRCQ15]MCH1626974.1 spore germination protein [Fredinandcohnia sp. SECRCQ15]